MNKTKIEWVKNPDGTQGYTWNPITGCLNGCSYCYARRLANGRLKPLYLSNSNVCDQSLSANDDPFYPRFWPERLEELHDRNRAIAERGLCPKERGIFVCDMGELFGDWVPEDWTEEVLHAIDLNEGHDRFYLLTKQPQNLAKWSPFPENCWVGVTVTDYSMLYEASLYLKDVEATIRFLSIEPCLDFTIFHPEDIDPEWLDWLIIGAQTKPYLPPKIEWVQEIVEAADKAGIKVFLKENLKPILPVQEPFYYWEDYGGGKQDDEDEETNILLRQEYP